jgi:hypothetical protein
MLISIAIRTSVRNAAKTSHSNNAPPAERRRRVRKTGTDACGRVTCIGGAATEAAGAVCCGATGETTRTSVGSSITS